MRNKGYKGLVPNLPTDMINNIQHPATAQEGKKRLFMSRRLTVNEGIVNAASKAEVFSYHSNQRNIMSRSTKRNSIDKNHDAYQTSTSYYNPGSSIRSQTRGDRNRDNKPNAKVLLNKFNMQRGLRPMTQEWPNKHTPRGEYL